MRPCSRSSSRGCRVLRVVLLRFGLLTQTLIHNLPTQGLLAQSQLTQSPNQTESLL